MQRQPSEEDRRRIVLSLTPAGRRLEKRADDLRQTQLDFFKQLLGNCDLSSELELVLEMLKYTPFSDLIDRRRELLEKSSR